MKNNHGRGRGYQLKPKAKADDPHRDLDYSGYHKNRIVIVMVLLYIEGRKRKSCFFLFH